MVCFIYYTEPFFLLIIIPQLPVPFVLCWRGHRIAKETWVSYYCWWFSCLNKSLLHNRFIIIIITKYFAGGSSHVAFPDSTNDDTTDVSLITGALRSSCLRSSSEQTSGSSSTSSVAVRNQTLTVANTNTAGKELKSSCFIISTRWNTENLQKTIFFSLIVTDLHFMLSSQFKIYITNVICKCQRSFTPRYLSLS